MRILRLNNDLCELAEIKGDLDIMQAEVKGYIEIVTLGATLRMVVNEESLFKDFKYNRPASILYRHSFAGGWIFGHAFLCSFNGIDDLTDLTDDDYEAAVKILRSYGFVKGEQP